MSTDQNDTLAPLAQVIAATNPELLLGNAPDSLAREIAADEAMMRNTLRGMDLLTAAMGSSAADKMYGEVMERTPTGNDLGKLAKEIGERFSNDGPIREPGDDVPSFGDVYGSPEEFATKLDKDSDQIARLGLYDVANDLAVAAQQISEMAEQIEVAKDKVKELVDEITALRGEIRDRDRY